MTAIDTATETPVVTTTFVKAKETKNTWKYEEVPPADQAPVSGTLYIAKHVVHRLGNPDAVVMTVAPLA